MALNRKQSKVDLFVRQIYSFYLSTLLHPGWEIVLPHHDHAIWCHQHQMSRMWFWSFESSTCYDILICGCTTLHSAWIIFARSRRLLHGRIKRLGQQSACSCGVEVLFWSQRHNFVLLTEFTRFVLVSSLSAKPSQRFPEFIRFFSVLVAVLFPIAELCFLSRSEDIYFIFLARLKMCIFYFS